MSRFQSKAFERAILLAVLETAQGIDDDMNWPELDAIGVHYGDTVKFVTDLVGDDDVAEAKATDTVYALLVSTFQYGLQIGVHLERQRHEGLGDDDHGE